MEHWVGQASETTEQWLLDMDLADASDAETDQAQNERLDNDEQFKATLTEL